MVVGTDRVADEAARIREYSPGTSTPEFRFDPERFAAHEVVFTETVPRWVRMRFGVALRRERTAVLGVSAGGEPALALGVCGIPSSTAQPSAPPPAVVRWAFAS